MGMSLFQKKLTHRNTDLKEQQHSCSEALIVPSRKKTQYTRLFPINSHGTSWYTKMENVHDKIQDRTISCAS